MKEYSYTESRQNLKSVISDAAIDHEVVRIKNRNGQSVIMIDEQDYNALVETAYLLRSPINANRLIEARNRSESEAIEYSELIESLDL